MSTCDCKLWDINIDKYNDMFNFVEKYHGPSYEGQEFAFCPWCGIVLKVEEQEDVDEDDDDEEEIDLTPMHGEDDEDDDEEEEEDFDDEEWQSLNWKLSRKF